jgi:hypothetical protein
VRRAEAERMAASTAISTSDESDLVQALTFDPSPHTGQYVTVQYVAVHVTVQYRM